MSRLVVALDVPNAGQAQAAIDELYDLDPLFKIGLEALFGYPERILSYCEERDVRCVIDAKLHDIPRTVAAAARQVVHPFVRAITVHASGGVEMMRVAVESVRARAAELEIRTPDVLGVTVLTSASSARGVLHLATHAREAGCDGIVCSVHETREVKALFGNDFLVMTPGVRPARSAHGDQRRVATPAEAVAAGADYIVVGRPILDAPDRRAAAAAILDEIASSSAA
jgi:orotidine-5'-phosphate decarboxylase